MGAHDRWFSRCNDHDTQANDLTKQHDNAKECGYCDEPSDDIEREHVVSPCLLCGHHSARSATTGSTPMARRAGSQTPTNATKPRPIECPAETVQPGVDRRRRDLAPVAHGARHTISGAVQEQLRQASGLPVSDVRSMGDGVSRSISRQRFNMLLMLMLVFGASALLLAAIGIYGLMAYSVLIVSDAPRAAQFQGASAPSRVGPQPFRICAKPSINHLAVIFRLAK